MFPDKKLTVKTPTNRHKQSGISLAILLFVIIVIAILAGALIKLNMQSNLSNAQQVIATRAFLAAESGAQIKAMEIFPVAGGTGPCNGTTPYSFNVTGLNGCTASVVCNTINVNGQDYYQVISTGQCNAGQPLQSTRTIEVRLKNIL